MMKRRSIQVNGFAANRDSGVGRAQSLHVVLEAKTGAADASDAASTPAAVSMFTSPLSPTKRAFSTEDEDAEFLKRLAATTDDWQTSLPETNWDVPVQDYESVVAANQQEINTDPLKDLLTIPSDDVYVEQRKRTFKTVAPVQKLDGTHSQALQDHFEFYTSDWVMVKRRYRKRPVFETVEGRRTELDRYGAIDVAYQIDQLSEARASSSETDLEKSKQESSPLGPANRNTSQSADSLSSTEAETLKPEMLKYVSGNCEREAFDLRRQSEHRAKLILAANGAEGELKGTDVQAPDALEPFSQPLSKRYKIDFEQLKLQTSLPEPIMAKVCLYDAKTSARCSETFRFDLREPNEHAIAFTTPSPAQSTLADGGISSLFHLAAAGPEVHLVVVLEKVTEGDPSAFLDRFISPKVKPLHVDKVQHTMRRLCKFRQAVALAVIPLFDASGQLLAQQTQSSSLLGNKARTVSIEQFQRIDGEHLLEDEIDALLGNGSQKKSATITRKGKYLTGNVTFKIAELASTDISLNVVDSSYRPLHPFLEDRFARPDRKFHVTSDVHSLVELAPDVPKTEDMNHLYVYPMHLNYSKGNSKFRNFVCKVQLCDLSAEGKPHPLQTLYDTDFNMTTEAFTSMVYHNRTPAFIDEFKMQLPLEAKPNYHLLFTFYHISCKGSAPEKKATPVENEAGFAFCPLFEEGKILEEGSHDLPITTHLPANYLQPNVQSQMKWLDARKPLFSFKSQLISSIHSKDRAVSVFSSALASAQDTTKLSQAIVGLKDAASTHLSAHSPVLLNQLIRLLCTEASEDMQEKCFDGIHQLLMSEYQSVSGARRSKSIDEYVRFVLRPNAAWPHQCHEQLLKYLLRRAKAPQNDDAPSILKFAWFFLSAINKSIFLAAKGGQGEHVALAASFLPSLGEIVVLLAQEVLVKSKTGLNMARDLNETTAHFLIDAAFLPKKDLFGFIRKYLEIISAEDTSTLLSLRFDFLSIICNYEHFVPLSLPLRSTFRPSFERITTLEKDFGKRHFLSSLLLSNLSKALQSTNEDIRTKALLTFETHLRRHDDKDVSEERLRRIHNLYLPFLNLAINNCVRLLRRSRPTPINPKKNQDVPFEAFTKKEKRIFYLCFLNIVKYMDRDVLIHWLERGSHTMFTIFSRLLIAAAAITEYPGAVALTESLAAATGKSARDKEKTKRALENMYKMDGQTMREKGRGYRQKSVTEAPSAHAGTAALVAAAAAPGHGGVGSTLKSFHLGGASAKIVQSDLEIFQMVMLRALEAMESSTIVLDAFESLVTRANQFLAYASGPDESERAKKQLEDLFDVLIALSDLEQCERMRQLLLTSIKLFLFRFSGLIFRSSEPRWTRFCPELCRVILDFNCSSQLEVRQLAAPVMYIALIRNWEEMRTNFGKVKVHNTVALSRLQIVDDAHLRKSLATIKAYAKSDTNRANHFKSKVGDFVDALFCILRDSVKIQAHRDDPEMLQDMTFRIANGYRNAPDLRLATLENLAQQHMTALNHSEAAFCYIHCAALVSDYLAQINHTHGGPRNSLSFKSCSPNVVEEGAMAVEVSPEEEGICQSHHFSESGILALMETSLPLFTKAQLHETLNEVYKLILPIYEQRRAYEKLSSAHTLLASAFEEIYRSQKTSRRILATYFRVGFYGSQFEILDGKEFIYKERTITQLSEICGRLTTIYRTRYGAQFELLQDSNKIDPKTLDPNKAYCQVTFVEPYWTPADLQSRVTYFERWNNISQFVFNTPFSPGGKAHSGVASQWTRQTILTVEKSFPYLKKRLQVVQREEIELDPLEVSTRAIVDRCTKLRNTIEADPVDIKQLQMLLQGSVRLQVNAGPLEIANVFLKTEVGKYDQKRISALKDAFIQFFDLCGVALRINKRLIKEDQLQYQQDLEQGYEDMHAKLRVFVPLRSDVRHSGQNLHDGIESSDAKLASAVDSVINFVKEQNAMNAVNRSKDELASFLGS